MSFSNRGDPPAQPDSVPVIRYNEQRAHDAWEAHRAMVLMECKKPTLRDNPEWISLRDAAANRFVEAFEGVGG